MGTYWQTWEKGGILKAWCGNGKYLMGTKLICSPGLWKQLGLGAGMGQGTWKPAGYGLRNLQNLVGAILFMCVCEEHESRNPDVRPFVLCWRMGPQKPCYQN